MSNTNAFTSQNYVSFQPQSSNLNTDASQQNFNTAVPPTFENSIRDNSMININSNAINVPTTTTLSTITNSNSDIPISNDARPKRATGNNKFIISEQINDTDQFAVLETSSSHSLTPNEDTSSSTQSSNDDRNNFSNSQYHVQPSNGGNKLSQQHQTGKSGKSGKVGKACDQCRFRKVKCNGENPCTRCVKSSASCTYNYVFKMRNSVKRKPVINDTEKPKRKRGRPPKIHLTSPPLSNLNLPSSKNDTHSTNDTNLERNTISQSYTKTDFTHIDAPSVINKQTPLLHNSKNSLSMFSNIPNIPPTPINPPHNLFASKADQMRQSYLSINHNQPSPPKFQSRYSSSQPEIFNYQPNYIPATPSFQDDNIKQYGKPFSTTSKPGETNLENRLQKLETMLSVLIDKVSSPSVNNIFTLKNKSSTSTLTPQSFPLNGTETLSTNLLLLDDGNDDDGTPDETYEITNTDQFNGLFTHTAIFFLSRLGLISLESKMPDPNLLLPLRKILGIVSPCEERAMSIWKNPISETKLTPFPSREMICYLIEKIISFNLIVQLIDMPHLKKLFRLYCDHRDGLIREPKFSYSEYFLMNAFLLMAIEVVSEMVRTNTISDEGFPGLSYFESIKGNILDNAIFYYVRVSVISGGLTAISASLLLSFYADWVSLSRAAYLISSTAIRQAQELGLHLEDSYRGLESNERNLKLNLWWTCYLIDKELCIRWGHTAVISDADVSAPPLPGFEAFWSPNNFESYPENLNGKETERKSVRSKRGVEIRATLTPLLENISKAAIVEQFVSVDYALLCSKIYHAFLRANAMKNITKKSINSVLVDTLHELDCWRKNIPLQIQPRDGDDDHEILEFINSMKKQNSKIAFYKMYMATEFHVRYHHLKLMIHRAYIKNWVLKFSEPFKISLCKEQMASARSILRLSFVVDNNFGNFINYFAFYPFHAFVLICAYYVHSKKKLPEMETDFKLLIDCLKVRLQEEIESDVCEKRRHINYVLKALFYATYHTCVARFGEFDLPGVEVLQDITEIQNGVKSIDEIVLIKTEPKRHAKVRPFCKMPYYENQDSTSSKLNQELSETLRNSNPARTPNVEFLLSPSNQPAVTPSYLEEMEFSKDNFFHNMLNIPNYFMDPLADD
ncbi:hypothetical protein CANINC_000085 [Pichia inconspicua]|uniref:Zn(2)-C6 fungal-type domain-containing protein n=1 Tax=Pichia inconspicua TaxID=52247 RepID=A0A4T0X794_9ASCO|nr:hypothetical protein CANINC_000085 [[Candida] inconspicua]